MNIHGYGWTDILEYPGANIQEFLNKCPVILFSGFSGIFKMNIYKNLLMNIHECQLVNVHVYSL